MRNALSRAVAGVLIGFVFLGFVFLGGMGCTSSSKILGLGGRPAGESREVARAISEAWRTHIAAAKRKDVEGVGELYADDVFYTIPGMIEVRGRSAIDAMERESLRSSDVLEARHETRSLVVADADLAYEVGTVVGPVRSKKEGRVEEVHFHYMARWVRGRAGKWRIQSLVGGTEGQR